jgi:hypothetical protein
MYIYICVAIHTHWGFSTSQASMLSTWGEVQMPRSAKRNWTPWQSTRDPWKSARSNLRKEPLMRSGKRICWCFFFGFVTKLGYPKFYWCIIMFPIMILEVYPIPFGVQFLRYNLFLSDTAHMFFHLVWVCKDIKK